MKEYTQTDFSPGNCLQTAIACILEVDPTELPPQTEIELLAREMPDLFEGWGSYKNALNGYLAKHHGLVYYQIDEHMFGGIKPSNPYSLLIGQTIRTDKFKKTGSPIYHCVVAKDGVPVWDTHPSRAFLTTVEHWGILGKIQRKTLEQNDIQMKMKSPKSAYHLIFNCLCPQCGLDELHLRVQKSWMLKGISPELESQLPKKKE